MRLLALALAVAALALGGCGKSSSSAGSAVLVDSNANGRTGHVSPNGLTATTPGQQLSVTAEPRPGYTVDWQGTTADADPALVHTVLAPASGTKLVTVTFVPTGGG